MEIRYKLYPYPVLWESNNDYKKSIFGTEIKIEHDRKQLRISCEFKTNNKELMNYILLGEAECIMHIECPLTAYRTVVPAENMSAHTEIADKLLNGKVSVCTFIVAKKNIAEYSNSDFNDDYAGTSFSIEKGSVLAIGKQFSTIISKFSDDLADLPSIFTICKTECYSKTEAQVQLDSNKIRIQVSALDFEKYQLVSGLPALEPLLHSAIVFPALVYAFEKLRTCGFEEYEGYRWPRAIAAAFKKQGINFDEEYVRDKDSFIMAQKLLDLPINRALEGIAGLDDGGDDII